MRGVWRNLFADALFMPTGLLAIAYLARRLGPTEFALFALAMALITPVAWVVTLPFAALPQWLAAHNGAGLAGLGTALRRQFLVAVGAMVIVWLAADAIAASVAIPALAPALRLYAFDIPLLALAHLCGGTIAALGLHKTRARGNIGRMLARPLLIVLLVELGFGVQGALLGTVGVSVVHLLLSAPALLRMSRSSRQLSALPAPASDPQPLIVLYQRIAERLDLVALALLIGGAASAQAIGIYGVAQFLPTLPVAIVTGTLASLRSDLPRRQPERQRDLLALAALPLPFAALAAGAAPDLLTIIFGELYREGADLLALLCLAAAAAILLHTGLTILCADGYPRLVLTLLVGLLLLSIPTQFALITLAGSLGAALATLVIAACGALVAMLIVQYRAPVQLPAREWTTCAFLAGIAYWTAAYFPAPGLLVIAKLALLAVSLTFALYLSGVLPLNRVSPAKPIRADG